MARLLFKAAKTAAVVTPNNNVHQLRLIICQQNKNIKLFIAPFLITLVGSSAQAFD